MPRGKGKSVGFDFKGDEFMLTPSQASNGSDDTTFELAIAEQYIASREKKKRQKQKNFLVAGRKYVLDEADSSTEKLKSAVQSMEDLLQAFSVNYATEDDRIRTLWSALLEEHSKLQKLSKRYLAACMKAGEECEREQITGMSKAQEAVLETQKVIEWIYPKDR